MALDFRTFWGPIAILSGNVNFFSIIIDIHFPENISAVVWIRSGKKPRTSSQSRFRISLKFAKKRGPVDPKSQGGFSIFPDPRIPNMLKFWVYDKRFGSY